MAVSIYCYLMKHHRKPKPLLPYHYIVSSLKETLYKIENSEKFKELNNKKSTCYYFDEITKFKDFDLDKNFNR